MKLINTSNFPPHGFLFYQPELNWRAPRELAQQGLDAVARALQSVRANNPQAGLDPSYEACVAAIGAYTCARLAGTKAFNDFCGGEPVTAQERAAVAAAQKRAAKVGGGGGCCGRS